MNFFRAHLSLFLGLGLIGCLTFGQTDAALAALSCRSIFTTGSYSTVSYEPYVTVDKVGEVTGLFGGTRSVIKLRPGEKWESRLRVNLDLKPNPYSAVSQGDPTFFVKIFGAKVAAAWGFKKIASNMVTLPDALEIQGAVDRINSRILDKTKMIQTKFYEVESHVSVEDYFNNFISLEGRRIPVAKSTILSVHDRSVHPIHALIPPELDDFAISSMRATKNYFNYIKAKRPDIYSQVSYNVRAIIEVRAAGIDIVSAAMTGLFIELDKPLSKQNPLVIESEVNRIWYAYLNEGRSAKERLHNLMEVLQQEVRQNTPSFGDNEEHFNDAVNPDIKAVETLFKEFEAVESRVNPLYSQTLNIRKEDIQSLMQKRIDFILSVINGEP